MKPSDPRDLPPGDPPPNPSLTPARLALTTLAQLLAATRAELAQAPVPPLSPAVRQALLARGTAAPVGSPATAAAAAAGATTGHPPGATTGQPPGRPGPRPRWGAALAMALPALALLGSLLGALWLARAPAPAGPGAGARLPSGFVMVVAPERWQRLRRETPGQAAWLVASEWPHERLAALGLPFDPSRAADAVPAELLLHPSGEVLAVRVLHH